MFRFVKTGLLAVLAVSILTGVSCAAMSPIPEKQPVVMQPVGRIPGDVQAMEAIRQGEAPFQIKILVADSADGEDRTEYLDRVATARGGPAADTLLLLLFKEHNWDTRFSMGLTLEEMLGLVRQHYLPGARAGEPASGLADYLKAVIERMGGTVPWQPKTHGTVADPFGGEPKSAAGAAGALLYRHVEGEAA